MIHSERITSSSNLDTFFQLSNDAYVRDKEKNRISARNYDVDGWETNNHCVAFALCNKLRFDPPNGIFDIILEDGNPIGFCGGYKYDDETFIGLSRAYVDVAHRNKALLNRFILPKQLLEAHDMGLSKLWLTFNDYNKGLFNYYKRARAASTTTTFFGSVFPNPDEIYEGTSKIICELAKIKEEQIYIQNTWQYVVEFDVKECNGILRDRTGG